MMELNLKKVERVQTISKKDFLNDFVRPQVPVVIENLVNDWPAVEKWDFNYLRKKVGDKVVPLYDDRPVDYKDGFNEPHTKMKMTEYIDLANILHFHFQGEKECILYPFGEKEHLYKVPHSLITHESIDFSNPYFEKWIDYKNERAVSDTNNKGQPSSNC
jgi:hypothetical protein